MYTLRPLYRELLQGVGGHRRVVQVAKSALAVLAPERVRACERARCEMRARLWLQQRQNAGNQHVAAFHHRLRDLLKLRWRSGPAVVHTPATRSDLKGLFLVGGSGRRAHLSHELIARVQLLCEG